MTIEEQALRFGWEMACRRCNPDVGFGFLPKTADEAWETYKNKPKFEEAEEQALRFGYEMAFRYCNPDIGANFLTPKTVAEAWDMYIKNKAE